MIFTAQDGTLRILDGSKILHGVEPLDDHTVDMVTWDGATTWTNVTAALSTDDTSYANNFLTDSSGMIFIGSTSKFALVQFLKGGGSDYAAGSGALIAKYINTSDALADLAGVDDGTESGGDCFVQDGYISFKIPGDWQLGGDGYDAALDSDKYYIGLMATDSPATDPDADVLCPVGGQYIDVPYVQGDLTAPAGRPPSEEKLILNRGKVDDHAHYINGPDDVIYKPVPLTFSSLVDDVYADIVLKALACGNPNIGHWTSVGVSTDGQSKNDGSNLNPGLRDTSKKAVNVQFLQAASAAGIDLGWAYYEALFPGNEISFTEEAEGNKLAFNGGVYGVIERITALANRY